MRLLKRRDVTPPDWYRFRDPDTGHETRALTYYDWVEKATEHRKANNLAIPHDFEAQMQDQICQTLDGEWCEYQTGDSRRWINTRLSLAEVVDFTKVLIAHTANAGRYVSEEEANRRASICRFCYLNVRIPGCGVCSGLATLVTGNRTTPYDSELQNCAACKCFNKSQVHFPLDVLEVNDTEERQQLYPKDFCWKSKQSPSYLTEE